MTSWQQQITTNIAEPADIHGYVNGQFPASALVDIYDRYGAWVGKSSPTVKRSYQAMVAAAARDGIYLSPRDPGSSPSASYRSRAEQDGLWDSNYQVSPPTNNGGRTCGGQYRYLRDGLNVCACPGTSNHGRTLAFDMNVEVEGNLAWLEQHAASFGFQWEIASESWHIHYCPGDNIPQATLDYEATLEEDDDDMKMYAVTGNHPDKGKWFVIVGNVRYYLTSMAQINDFRAAGVKEAAIGADGWAAVCRTTALDIQALRDLSPNGQAQLSLIVSQTAPKASA